MKKGGKKMQTRLRVRPRLAIKKIMIYSVCSAALLLSLTLIFNLLDIRVSKANPCEIMLAEDQEFINDMSLRSPVIKHQKVAGPNTVFIHKIKPSQDLPSKSHE